jgi:hypothetical protein
MKNPYLVGMPPELSINDELYSLKFHTGAGAGWGLESSDIAIENISKKILLMQKILRFINMNENKLNDENIFIKLENLFVNYFENW